MDSETNNNIIESLNQYLPSRTQEYSLNRDVSKKKLSFPTFKKNTMVKVKRSLG